MATIADVASYAGVGAGTVSRVLNDRPNVRPETRARVREAIAALDYHPSQLARGLSRGRSAVLRLVMPSRQAVECERLSGVVEEVGGSGYDLVLVDAPATGGLSGLAGRDHAAGMLVMSFVPSRADLLRLRRAGVPLVLVGTKAPNVAAVLADDAAGGRLAARHLVALGHESVALLGPDPADPFGDAGAERERGFREALAEAGLPARAVQVAYGPADRAGGRRLAARLLARQHPPTAIVASSVTQALGVLEAAREAGLEVPEDLSVVGGGDGDAAAYAGLTTTAPPQREVARRAARRLLDAVAGARLAPTADVLPVALVERATTATPRPREGG